MKKEGKTHPDWEISRIIHIDDRWVVIRSKFIEKDGKKEEALSLQMMNKKIKKWKEIVKEYEFQSKKITKTIPNNQK